MNDVNASIISLYRLILACTMLRKKHFGQRSSPHHYPRQVLSFLLILEHWRKTNYVAIQCQFLATQATLLRLNALPEDEKDNEEDTMPASINTTADSQENSTLLQQPASSSAPNAEEETKLEVECFECGSNLEAGYDVDIRFAIRVRTKFRTIPTAATLYPMASSDAWRATTNMERPKQYPLPSRPQHSLFSTQIPHFFA